MNHTPPRDVVVFTEAIRLPAIERAGYLTHACAGDPELRRKVEALLDAHDQVGDFLEDSPPGVGSGLRAEAQGEKPGDWIGRYRLLQQIGEGGCGVVYMAEQEVPVRRRVALKIIKPGMDTKSVIARFEAERQALALMDHPSIAKVFDAGATESGRPYFVMELIRGIKITEYCDQQALSTKDRLQLFVQVCQAVQHAHQKGIIHRDLKPSNILVTMTPESVALPVVIDFGIAKATTNQRLTDKTLFTAFEMLIGTPAYMSPEQTALTSVDVDTRTDIYSLGVLLYELLTGSTPFDAGELLKAGLDEVRKVIREQEPPRPSARLSKLTAADLTSVAQRRDAEPPALIRSVRGDLDWIVMRALEKDRSRRYETATGLAADVKRFLTNETVAARPPSAGYRFGKMVARHTLLFGFLSAIALLSVVSLTLIAASLVKERRARREVQAEAEKSRQVTRFLGEMLQGVGPSAALGRDTTLLREILDQAAIRLGADLTDQPATRGELRSRIGSIYQELALYAEAEAMGRAATIDLRQAAGINEEALASALANLGLVLMKRYKLDEAEQTLREARSIRQKIFGRKTALAASALKDLAKVHLRQNRYAEAAASNDEALEIYRKLAGEDTLEVADCLNTRGTLVGFEHKLVEAETLAREVLAIRRKLLPADHPLVASALYNLGIALDQELKAAEAEAALREALAIRRRIYRPDHAEIVSSIFGLGDVLKQEGKLAEAETLIREVYAGETRVWGEEHPRTLLALTALVSVLNEEIKFPEAEVFGRKAVASLQKIRDAQPQLYATALDQLANTQRNQGNLAEAEANYRLNIAYQLKTMDPEHPYVLLSKANLGSTLRREGKVLEAEALLREAAAFYRKTQGDNGTNKRTQLPDYFYAYCLEQLDQTLVAEGKIAEAEAVRNELAAWRQKLAAHGIETKKP